MKSCLALLLVALTFSCATAPSSDSEKNVLRERVAAAERMFRESDASMGRFFEKSHGWAIFPNIAKGGLGVGGAYGRGEVYEKGEFVGYCDLTQGTIGFQLGGQSYSEIIFFETAGTAATFKAGEVAVAAQASAVVAKSGAAEAADYKDGVAIFIGAKEGIMGEASIGGQSFDFEPASRSR